MEASTFEAYSYRTGSRFGSRVRVSVANGTVSVAGPRVGSLIYRPWIALQVVLEAAVAVALVAALVRWDWHYLLAALAPLIAHWGFSGTGAVALWEYANVMSFASGTSGSTTSFTVSSVRDVRFCHGWARRGLWLVICPTSLP